MRKASSFFLAVLKVIVDLLTMLIGAEGARFLREYGSGETPQALKRRGGSPNRARKAKRLKRKSTAKFNRSFTLKGTFSVPSFNTVFFLENSGYIFSDKKNQGL
jgi:hypothetical protein